MTIHRDPFFPPPLALPPALEVGTIFSSVFFFFLFPFPRFINGGVGATATGAKRCVSLYALGSLPILLPPPLPPEAGGNVTLWARGMIVVRPPLFSLVGAVLVLGSPILSMVSSLPYAGRAWRFGVDEDAEARDCRLFLLVCDKSRECRGEGDGLLLLVGMLLLRA